MRPLARVAVPAMVVALLMAAACVDHFFRDEFYYLACTHHMAWGYVDQPPLSVAVLRVVRHLAGESLLALRLVAALALAGSIWLTGSVARRLGAGAFGELLAMVAMAIPPELLAIGSFYSMNVFDLLFWTAAIRVLLEAIDGGTARTWALLGLLLGIGLLNKISVLWLAAGIAAAIVLTPARRALLTPGPYLAATIAALIFLPHVLWQIANGWPTLEFIRNASSEKMQSRTPLAFMAEQVMNLHPITLPIWGAGLVGLFVHPRLRRYRGLAIIYLAVAVILIANRTSRSGYLLPAYPPLIAAGATLWESWIERRAARAAVLAALGLAGAATVPLALPILPTDAYVRYSAALGVAPSTEERKELGRLPQFFADRQGWDAFAAQVTRAWQQLTPDEQRSAAVLAGNYGEAGALERLAHLPVISGHNNYWLWGPGGRTGEILLVLTKHPERLERSFASVKNAGEIECGDCMPYENHLGIYIVRQIHAPLGQIWDRLKHYD